MRFATSKNLRNVPSTLHILIFNYASRASYTDIAFATIACKVVNFGGVEEFSGPS